MSQENMDVVRDAIDAFNRGGWGAAMAYTAPDFVFDNSRAIGEQRGGYASAEEMRRLAAWGADLWESMRFEIDEMIVVGNRVVVPHTTLVRGRDGIEVHARTTWLITVSGGKIERICLYQERQEALDAAELRE
jgi:hypothetical protein